MSIIKKLIVNADAESRYLTTREMDQIKDCSNPIWVVNVSCSDLRLLEAAVTPRQDDGIGDQPDGLSVAAGGQSETSKK